MASVKKRFENDGTLLESIHAFVQGELLRSRLGQADAYNSANLACSIAKLMAKEDTAFIGVAVRKASGGVVLRIVSEGTAYDPLEDLDLPTLLDSDPPKTDDFDTPLPRDQLLKALRNSLSYYRRNQRNEVEYVVRKGQSQTLKLVTLAFCLAIVAGLMLRYWGGDTLRTVTADYLLTPLRTMFLNALKMIVVPVVFFAISSSVASVSDIREYGRVGMKVLLFYTMTSFLAIGVGLLVYEIVQPGSGVTPDVGSYVYSAETTELSILDSIVNIVPTSFVGAFTNMEMLQIIFLAILTGAAATLLDNGGDRQRVSDFLGLMNRLFLKIASIVMKAIPLVTFCAMTLLVLDMDGAMILALLKLVLSMGLGAVCMFVVYSLLLLLSLRRNPAKFFKKCIPNFISFITFCSTSAVMPQSLETCRKELGISPKISSFSMPLGSTINMDGACVYLTISILFLAAVYQVPITAGMLVQLAFTILILSMGAPPIAGAGFICLSILVQQVGIPLESLGILMGIDQIMSMCRTLVNGTGDFVGTASVAKSENLMDLSVFDRR